MSTFDNKGSIFTSVLKKRQKRSNFNLSHDVKLSLDMAALVPTYIQECIPGDKVTINTSSMLRMAPLVSPVMHKINVYMEYFFVPNRILWENWETFITGSRNGKQLSADEMPEFPVLNPFSNPFFTNENGSVSDYMGIPTDASFEVGQEPPSEITVNALPFAGYQRIYDEYYRDENLITSLYDVYDPSPFEAYNKLPDGVQGTQIHQQMGTVRTRCWEHDYFTSALPWAQKGEQVSIPMDLSFDQSVPTRWTNESGFPFNDDTIPAQFQASTPTPGDPDNAVHMSLPTDDVGNPYAAVNVDNSQSLINTTTINDLRAAIKLQEWLETNARGGSRYFESIYAHFGVSSPDSRLQRPEFIGSNRSNMIISEVLQTSSPQSATDTPQGNMSGHGSSVGSSRNFKYYCQEHGYIIGIMSVMPKTAYYQGLERHWRKTDDRLQYYFPEFAHLGEQEIQNAEVYCGGDLNTTLGTFGYTPRYSEYKFQNSRVAGDFRDTLKYWHLGRDFASAPALNDVFVGADPSKRIYAVQDLPDDGGTGGSVRDFHSIYAHVFHDVKCSRLMPKYGTPSL